MKGLAKTLSTVRLRKIEDRKEWYLYIESYPVFVADKKTTSTSAGIPQPHRFNCGMGQKTYRPHRS